eukprot:7556130-Alexandrium_andersonii.AAC.1
MTKEGALVVGCLAWGSRGVGDGGTPDIQASGLVRVDDWVRHGGVGVVGGVGVGECGSVWCCGGGCVA